MKIKTILILFLVFLMIPLVGFHYQDQEHQHKHKGLELYELQRIRYGDRFYWQMPNRVMDELNITPGMTIADVGAGIGYFTLILAKRVEEKGKVYASDIDEDALNIVNQLHLNYKTGTKTYSDATSISTYWLREKFISNTRIADVTSADEFGNWYIADNKDPKKKIVMTINSEFAYQKFLIVNDLTDQVNSYTWTVNDFFTNKSIDNVIPGESCKINNIESTLPSNLLITKKEYTPDKIKLYLEKFDNFISLIKE